MSWLGVRRRTGRALGCLTGVARRGCNAALGPTALPRVAMRRESAPVTERAPQLQPSQEVVIVARAHSNELRLLGLLVAMHPDQSDDQGKIASAHASKAASAPRVSLRFALAGGGAAAPVLVVMFPGQPKVAVAQVLGIRRDAMLKWPIWIGVVCEDLEAQRKFYRDTLGLNEVRAGEGFVWFEFEGRLFELLAKSDKPQYDRRLVGLLSSLPVALEPHPVVLTQSEA